MCPGRPASAARSHSPLVATSHGSHTGLTALGCGLQHGLWRASARRPCLTAWRLPRTTDLGLRPSLASSVRSYGVAHRELIPESIHDTTQYANNRAELSHQPTRVRERGMRCFKSSRQAQRFLGAHAAVYNLFNLGRHLVSAKNYRILRSRAFASWKYAVAR